MYDEVRKAVVALPWAPFAPPPPAALKGGARDEGDLTSYMLAARKAAVVLIKGAS